MSGTDGSSAADRAGGGTGSLPHLLDPLSAGEFRQAAAILRRDRGVGETWRFASIELREPDKAVLAAWRQGDVIRREAAVVCWNRSDGQVYAATVSLTDDEVTSFTRRTGV